MITTRTKREMENMQLSGHQCYQQQLQSLFDIVVTLVGKSKVWVGSKINSLLFFSFVAGVILLEKLHSFERLLWRACRGNVFLRHSQISDALEDPISVSLKLLQAYDRFLPVGKCTVFPDRCNFWLCAVLQLGNCSKQDSTVVSTFAYST